MLRIKDIDFERSTITVRAAKGDKDKQTLFPESIKNELQSHLDQIYNFFKEDRDNNRNGVWLPNALERKYLNAGKEWKWFWVFPSKSISVDPRTNIIRRHHLHPSPIQRALQTQNVKPVVAFLKF